MRGGFLVVFEKEIGMFMQQVFTGGEDTLFKEAGGSVWFWFAYIIPGQACLLPWEFLVSQS